MESALRQHFWIVHVAFLLLVAFLAAKTVNLFIGASVEPLPTAPPAASRAPDTRLSSVANLPLERLAELTGLPLPKPEPDVKEPTDLPPEVDMSAEPVRTSLPLQLLGTLVSSNEEFSMASILETGRPKPESYLTGGTVRGARILEIRREKVIIANDGRREFIDATPGSGAGAPRSAPIASAPAARRAASGGDVELGAGIQETGANTYEVPREEIDKTLANLNAVAMQARIVPSFKDGQAEGFKLFSIRPNSLYSKIGVRNGDVIKRINGFELNSPEKALEVYQKLQNANRIDLELERNGATVRKTYTIR